VLWEWSRMGLTALSNGVLLPRKMQALGISAKTACAIAGVSPTRLSVCTAGQKDLPAADAAKLHALLAKLNEIQSAIPFPLSFANAARWVAILEYLERENIGIAAMAECLEKIFNCNAL
jgi:hypothetical protein